MSKEQIEAVEILISDINWGKSLYAREKDNQEAVDNYADILSSGKKLPPIKLYYDGSSYYPADGWHRKAACEKIGKNTISAHIKPGNWQDAFHYATGKANSEHGVQLSKGDKQARVMMVLKNKAYEIWTQEQVAEHCRVSQAFVSKIKGGIITVIIPNPPKKQRIQTRGSHVIAVNTSKRGRPRGSKTKQEPKKVTPANRVSQAEDDFLDALRSATEGMKSREAYNLLKDNLDKHILYAVSHKLGYEEEVISSGEFN